MQHTGRNGSIDRGGRRARSRCAAGAIGLVWLLAACSSSDAGPAAEPPVTDPPPATAEEPETTTTSTTSTTSTIVTTDPPPVVNTVAPASSEPAPDTTATEPPAAPTSTTFDPATPSGEVERAVLANLAAFVTCLEELPNCDVEKATANALLDYADGNTDLIREWNAAGYEARDTADYNFRVDEIELFVEGTEALVLTCVWGGTQLVLPATATSPEVLIDGEYTSSVNRYLVRRINDSWYVTANDPLEQSVGADQNICV